MFRIKSTCVLLTIAVLLTAGGCGGSISGSIPGGMLTKPRAISAAMAPLTILACVAGSCAYHAALPNGDVGTRYGYRLWCIFHGIPLCNYGIILQASGGLAPYKTWSLTGQPPGLGLGCFWNLSGCYDPDLREISGTPTRAGTYSIVVTVTDSESPPRQASVRYGITITP
jgi:hypothetical protein